MKIKETITATREYDILISEGNFGGNLLLLHPK